MSNYLPLLSSSDASEEVPTKNSRAPDPEPNDEDTDQSHHPHSEGLVSVSEKAKQHIPVPIRPLSLLAFSFVFIILLASLAFLYYLSHQGKGLRMYTTNHYTWTYGPTAVFVTIVSFWRLVDYTCKALVPWQELEKTSPSERSVWLDHISEFLVFTIVRAARFGHTSVVVTIAGFLILKLATLASTGLFMPAVTEVESLGIPIKRVSRFDNFTALDLSTDLSDYKPDPFGLYTLYAVSDRGIQATEGVTNNLLYETLRPATIKNPRNATLYVRSRAFVPQITCNAVELVVSMRISDISDSYAEVSRTVQWPVYLLDSPGWSCDREPGLSRFRSTSTAMPSRQLWPFAYTISCNSTSDPAASEQMLLVLGLAELSQFQPDNVSRDNNSSVNGSGIAVDEADFVTADESSLNNSAVAATICQVSYRIAQVELIYHFSELGDVHVTVGEVDLSEDLASKMAKFNSTSLTIAAGSAMDGGIALLGTGIDLVYAEQPPIAVFKFIASSMEGDYELLLDNATALARGAEKVFSSSLVFTMSGVTTYETDEVLEGVTGKIVYSMSRLYLQPIPSFLMFASIAIMLVLTFILYLSRPILRSCQDPRSTQSVLGLLRESPVVQKYLQGLSQYSQSEATRRTSQDTCTVTAALSGRPTLEIIAITRQTLQEEDTRIAKFSPSSRIETYSPMTLKGAFIAVTVLSALLLIGVLECTQRISDASKHGLRSMNGLKAIEVSVLTRYLPGSIALCVATMFNILDFNTATLASYNKLRSRTDSLQHSSTSTLSQLPPIALYLAFKCKYWTLTLTSLAALVGSTLTIVVSGLFVVKSAPLSSTLEVVVSETWNISFHQGLSTDNATAAVVSVLESTNLSYPPFTFGEMVFPVVSMKQDLKAQNQSLAGLITVRVPALRAELVCTELDPDQIDHEVAEYYSKNVRTAGISYSMTVPIPAYCSLGSEYRNGSFVRTAPITVYHHPLTNTSYQGGFQNLYLGPWDTDSDTVDGMVPNQPDNPPGCPSVTISYAYVDADSVAVTARVCEQRIQRMETLLTLRTVDMSISTSPIPDESSASYINSGPNNETAFWWRLQAAMQESLYIFNKTAVDPFLLEYDTDLLANDVSGFFRGALFGRTPLPLSYLKAQDRGSKDKLFEHLLKFYRRYMAQYISANMRVPIPGEQEFLNATYIPDVGIPCLKQDRTTTLVLQSMLAFMFICGSLAWSFNKYHDLVLWNPCTIFGVMVLFAGSKCCEPAHGNENEIHDGAKADTESLRPVGGPEEPDTEDDEALELMPFSEDTRPTVDTDGNQLPTPTQEFDLLDTEVLPPGDVDTYDGRKTRLRLGWWRDGIFMCPDMKRLDHNDGDDPNDGTWRYGIDVMQ